MRHVIGREHLLDILGECPRRAIQRAVLTDTVECLGLFNKVAPDVLYPAWMYRVTGAKQEWIVAALLKEHGKVGFRILKEIPWQYWNSDNRKGLAAGDNHIAYRMKRHEAVSKGL